MSVPTRFEPNEYMICFEIVKFKLLQILSHIPFFFPPAYVLSIYLICVVQRQ